MRRLTLLKNLLNLKTLALAGVATMTAMSFAQFSNPANDVPAYHAAAPTKGEVLPPLLSGKQLTGEYFSHPYQVKIYELAAKVSNVLYQEPCYCHCDRGMGHKSLHSCFEGTHGAECSTCMMEALYTYRQTMAGKTPAQIRVGIERGDWQSVDATEP